MCTCTGAPAGVVGAADVMGAADVVGAALVLVLCVVVAAAAPSDDPSWHAVSARPAASTSTAHLPRPPGRTPGCPMSTCIPLVPERDNRGPPGREPRHVRRGAAGRARD